MAQQTGSIYATSNPSGANVYLDGTYKGVSPLTISNVPVGQHTVKFTKTGYDDCEKTVTVVANQQKNLHCDLTPQVGSIYATSNPSGANVYLDGTYKGVSPLTISNVPVGQHTVKFTKTGYDDCEKTVTVVANQQKNLHCDLTPQVGSIYATSNPSGANVYLDGTYKGVSPLTISNVPVGQHTVKFTKTGYDDCEKTVTVVANQQKNLHCDLTPQVGSIYATSNPSGANVYLDGTYKGVSPLTISNVPVGQHTVKFTKTGYDDCEKTVTVVANQQKNLHCDLTQQVGSIYATSNPSGANVYLDGTYKGVSPLTISNVPVGQHTVKFTKTGYNDCEKTVTVVANQQKNVHCDLQPEDTISPSAVTDLATTDPTTNSIKLTWTAPGDDGNTGTATTYDIRYLEGTPIAESNWASAIPCTDEPSPNPAGSAEAFVVTGLSPGKTYYFALKTADEVPNWSPISNSPSGTTEGAAITATRDISPQQVMNGSTFTVTVTIIANQDIYAPILDEDPPTGWSVTSVQNDGATFKESEIKWLWTESLSKGDSRTVIYNVTVPSDTEPKDYMLTGNVSAYGVEPITVGGDNTITIITDWNPWDDDGIITDSEIQEAVYCWLTDTPKNDHLIMDSEIQELVYMWLTG